MILRAILLLGILSCSSNKGQWGRIKNFEQLKKNHTVGADYLVNAQYKKNTPLIIAVHGGKVESGTSELLHEVAKEEYSFYEFKALAAPDYQRDTLQSGYLHLTSHKFDDPLIYELASKSNLCLSLHGYPAKKSKADFCVGGANKELRSKIVKKLQQDFPELISCELCCPPYNGLHKKNVVNLCKNQGVQIELSPNARAKILKSLKFRAHLASSLRDSL